MKLPIRTLGLAVAALLIGSALAPVAAQSQQSGVDGQVAVRSDGALYLISNGQRRWIATVVATDDEINAMPEGEPIFAGLAPAGSAQAAAPPPQPATAAASPAAAASPGPAQPSTKTATTSAKTASSKESKPTSSTANEELSTDIPIEIVVDGSTKLEPGDARRVEIKSRKDVTCELILRLPDGREYAEDSKNADSQGRCRYTIEIPSGADEGNGQVIGTVREGGKVNRQEIIIEIEE
jgi:hypothetical protein